MSPRNKVIRGLRLGIMSLIPAVILFGGMEAYSTLAIQRAVMVETDASGERRYTMRIGKLPWSRKSIIPLNQDGFPDVAFDRVGAKQNCTHVVFLGDSFVFGDGVDRDSSFVSLIRQWADTRLERCLRVFNLGERGTTIDRQANNLRKYIERLQPDVVILVQYQNDLTDLTHSQSERAHKQAAAQGVEWRSARDRFRSMDLNVVRFASYHLFSGAIQRGVRYDLLKHWSVIADSSRTELASKLKANYESEFVRLRDELVERHVALGTVIVPSKFDVLADRFPEDEFFAGLSERHFVPSLRAFPILDGNREPNPFLLYDGHLNERGNRILAEAIYDWMFTREPAAIPRLHAHAASRAQAAANSAN
jgi:hypothetical protein